MIFVHELTKTFKLSRRQKREMGRASTDSTIDAVKDVSFTSQPGRIFTLLGPNGAGKTTALRMIATMLKPTSGTITVCGYDITQKPQEVRRCLGFLTGTTGLYDRLTQNEIVKYYADLHGMDKNVFQRRRDELFTLLDVYEFANRRIGKLSTGMRQKVSIIRTIIHDPEVIVFDEPTAGLDVVASSLDDPRYRSRVHRHDARDYAGDEDSTDSHFERLARHEGYHCRNHQAAANGGGVYLTDSLSGTQSLRLCALV